MASTVGLGDLFLASPDIHEFELNPVIVNREGRGLRIVDALVVATMSNRAGVAINEKPQHAH